MGFQWDPVKAATNLAKHGVSLSDAESVFFDGRALTREDPDAPEERYLALGMDALGRVLLVVYCWRADDIRIISARKADRAERSHYGQVEW